jgi:hypothetical protein
MGSWPIGDFQASRSDRLSQQTARCPERLDKLHTQLKESPIRPFLDTEVEHCRRFLLQPVRFITEDTEKEAAAPQSFWGRFFLTRPAVSPRKRVFKGLFYLFFAFGMLMLVATMPLVLSSDESGARWIGYLLGVLLGVLFYFIPAFLFRLAAR